MLENLKIKVSSEAESREAQELFQKLVGKENGFITIDKSIRWVALYQGQVVQYEFLPSVELNEITLPELRAMVKSGEQPSLKDQYLEQAKKINDACASVFKKKDDLLTAMLNHSSVGINNQYAEIEQVRQHRHYFIDVSDVDEIDFYEIALRYKVTDPCIQHILKKCLAVGQRGQKDFHHDLKDIYDTAKRMLDVHGLDS